MFCLKLRFFLISLVFFIPSVFAEGHLWDFLRPAAEMAGSYDFFTRVIVLVLTLGLAGVSFLAYNKAKSQKLLFVLIAFGLFALKWLLKVLDLFISTGAFFSDASENVFELLILASLFYALFVKK